MSKAEASIITIFRRLSEAIDLLSDEEIGRLSDPQYGVEIKAVRRRTKDESDNRKSTIDVEDVIAIITSKPSRSEAQSFLDESYSNKKVLEQIARRLDIPIVRQDKADVLRDKIIEATVGARIRSQAIQGTGV